MAEIHIQKKERTVWPWVAAGILVLALAWYFSSRNTDPTVAAKSADTTMRRDSSAGMLAPRSDSMIRRDTMPARPPN